MTTPQFVKGMKLNDFLRQVEQFKTNEREKKCKLFFKFINEAMEIKIKEMEFTEFFKFSGIAEYKLFKNFGHFVKTFNDYLPEFKKSGFISDDLDCGLESLTRENLIKHLRYITQIIGYKMTVKTYTPKENEKWEDGKQKTSYKYFIFKLID